MRRALILCAAAAVVTGCSAPSTHRDSGALTPVPLTTAVTTVPSSPVSSAQHTEPPVTAVTPSTVAPLPTAPKPSDPVSIIGDAESTLISFEQAWCPFRWDENPAIRIRRAQDWATPDAGLIVDPIWWRTIDAHRTVATCDIYRVYQVPTAPNTATVKYLRISMTRISVDGDTGGRGEQPITESRMLGLTAGGWRVGPLFVGG